METTCPRCRKEHQGGGLKFPILWEGERRFLCTPCRDQIKSIIVRGAERVFERNPGTPPEAFKPAIASLIQSVGRQGGKEFEAALGLDVFIELRLI